MVSKRAARHYAVMAHKAELRRESPEIPRFIPAYGPLARFITWRRRRKLRHMQRSS